MKKIIMVFVHVFGLMAHSAETVICKGESWNYKFVVDADKCSHEQKTSKDISGIYKKGHTNRFSGKDALTVIDCWKSIAKIQIDGAICCVDNSENPTSCKSKNLAF